MRVDKVQREHVQKSLCVHVWAACNPKYGSRIHVMPMEWGVNQPLYIDSVAISTKNGNQTSGLYFWMKIRVPM